MTAVEERALRMLPPAVREDYERECQAWSDFFAAIPRMTAQLREIRAFGERGILLDAILSAMCDDENSTDATQERPQRQYRAALGERSW